MARLSGGRENGRFIVKPDHIHKNFFHKFISISCRPTEFMHAMLLCLLNLGHFVVFISLFAPLPIISAFTMTSSTISSNTSSFYCVTSGFILFVVW